MSDIIISGYHGFRNSGDEALLFAILSTLRKKKPDISVTVLSKTPEDTARVYGVKSIGRYNLFEIVKEMKKAKMLLFGGGSLLQDVTSSKSIKYYLGIIGLAHMCGLKTMLYANGIGPIVKKGDRHLAAKLLDKVEVITLRDDKSDIELKNLGVTRPMIEITADPAFTLDTDLTLSGEYYKKMAGVPEGTKLAVVSVREWKNSVKDFNDIIASLCDFLVEKHGIYPLFVPMQYPHDTRISGEIRSRMKNRSYIINRELTVPEMFSVLSEAELVIGMRLHSLIYATTLEKPAMALVYDPKVSAFMESIGQSACIDVERLCKSEAESVLDSMVTGREESRRKLKETNALLKEKAEKNADYAIELLK
ncbi:MAG: polysaccharide pyruvyl transferase CsaB [Clostridia bacterium]|nr:polysaccharide pyruvyl transferase CsaB [Clostridia bacterium]